MIIPGSIAAAAETWRKAEGYEHERRLDFQKATTELERLETNARNVNGKVGDQRSLVSTMLSKLNHAAEEVARAAEVWAERKGRSDE